MSNTIRILPQSSTERLVILRGTKAPELVDMDREQKRAPAIQEEVVIYLFILLQKTSCATQTLTSLWFQMEFT